MLKLYYIYYISNVFWSSYMENFTTPMMKQYMQIKKQYSDCLLFFRMGDFYELFLEDAHTGARVLDITLTGRPNGKQGRIPMAGVPFHAVDSYLSKLVKAGYKVAICEQMSEPDKYGIVDREVIRIVTPGTVLDEKALDKKANNFIISLSIGEKSFGMAAADISTGLFQVAEFDSTYLNQIVIDELARLSPSECVLHESLSNNPLFLKLLKIQKGLNIYCFNDWEKYSDNAAPFLKKQFKVRTLMGFGIDGKEQAIRTAAALMGYLKHTQKDKVGHFKSISLFNQKDSLVLDKSTMVNLELFSTLRDHDSEGSLIDTLDHTVTAMGGRMLKNWMRTPLTVTAEIVKRHDAVEEFMNDHTGRESLRLLLSEVADIERVVSRLSVGIGNARDLISLKNSLSTIVRIRTELDMYTSYETRAICKQILTELTDIVQQIEKHIVDDPPFGLKDGGLIKNNINPELDILRTKVGGGRNWIMQLEKSERERTGITSLKVRYNKVFGFYIEISKSNLHLIPDNYIRKQTLVNGERFITPELKEQEEIILTAEETMNKMEYEIYLSVLEHVLVHTEKLQSAASAIANLDGLLNFAQIAYMQGYCRPELIDSGEIHITKGRHPVVERLLDNTQFVPNDVNLNRDEHQLLLITGPNMAGKSVYIRQVALIVLMAQMGSFVPAEKARITPVDKIFVRSGAADIITSGLSTFMVEMVETANILHNATSDSLIVMDEIGRGTSTYDGISIAWAVAEYLVSNSTVAPKTLFATHYHELQTLEQQYPDKIKNYHVSVDNRNGEPVFLHTVASGGASHSFGVAVAKLAGVPEKAVARAVEILHSLEKRELAVVRSSTGTELPSTDDEIRSSLKKLDIHTITPLEALNILAALKEKV